MQKMLILLLSVLLYGCAFSAENAPAQGETAFSFQAPLTMPSIALMVSVEYARPPLAPERDSFGLALLGMPDYGNRIFGMVVFPFDACPRTDIYGLFAGMYGCVRELDGAQVSLANATQDAHGVQFGAVGNLSGGNTGIQIGSLYNFSAGCDAMQIALLGNLSAPSDIIVQRFSHPVWRSNLSFLNEVPRKTKSSAHLQISLVNVSAYDEDYSCQFGLFNSASGNTLQFGLLNFAEDAWLPVFPLFNFAF